jgi:hypothetical protein
VFIAQITDDFILGLEIMQAHNESVNFGGKCCKWAEVKRRCGDPELGDYRLDSLCAAMSLF